MATTLIDKFHVLSDREDHCNGDQANMHEQEETEDADLHLAYIVSSLGRGHEICEAVEQHDDAPAYALVKDGQLVVLSFCKRSPAQQYD